MDDPGHLAHENNLVAEALVDAPGAADQGWVPVVHSELLPPGGVVGFDHDDSGPLVVWRSEGGRVVAMDDRCPHQWSSLRAVGVVDGEEIVCTTHFWRFGTDGAGCKQSMHGRRDEKDPVDVVATVDDGDRVWIRPGGD
jgi:phenylpropionate dioxygenase-like ring-hydroxylating dioxygenase large terminal subunit